MEKTEVIIKTIKICKKLLSFPNTEFSPKYLKTYKAEIITNGVKHNTYF